MAKKGLGGFSHHQLPGVIVTRLNIHNIIPRPICNSTWFLTGDFYVVDINCLISDFPSNEKVKYVSVTCFASN
jgi:hypothetical protein